MSSIRVCGLHLLFGVLLLNATTSRTISAEEEIADQKPAGKVVQLFDGKTLKNWKITRFGGEGDVRVEDEMLIIDQGEPITGVTWDGPELPRVNYEISFDAQRVQGNDFFCALTFPVKKDPCSLILGGWGGTVIGLSNINNFDASENDTTDYFSFENKKWYKVRVRVDDQFIQCWLDEDQIVKVDHTQERISIRIEMELSKPLGIATFQTRGAIKNMQLVHLKTENAATSKEANPAP